VGDGAREEERRRKRADSDLGCTGIKEFRRRYLRLRRAIFSGLAAQSSDRGWGKWRGEAGTKEGELGRRFLAREEWGKGRRGRGIVQE
jgi:hypothetical protein